MTQPEVTNTAIAKIRLNDTQREAVEYYLHRTTLLWNYLVSRTKGDLEHYMASPESEQVDLRMTKALNAAENAILDKDYQFIPEEWHAYVPTILELDTDLIVYRVDDFERAYRRAKKDKYNRQPGRPPQSGIPQYKNGRSNQSIRFPPELFTMNDGIIKVTGPHGFELSLSVFDKEIPQGPLDLVMTRRRHQVDQTVDYGPVDNVDVIYTVTLRQVKNFND